MKTELWLTGKTDKHLADGIDAYVRRLGHYLPFELAVIPDVKGGGSLPEAELMRREGATVLKRLDRGDHLLLLDERGKALTSEAFAEFLSAKLSGTHRRLVFLVGGAFGCSEEIHERADGKISLSMMTFPHQLVRLVFVEQLYRAMTILRNEPYHHGRRQA